MTVKNSHAKHNVKFLKFSQLLCMLKKIKSEMLSLKSDIKIKLAIRMESKRSVFYTLIIPFNLPLTVNNLELEGSIKMSHKPEVSLTIAALLCRFFERS